MFQTSQAAACRNGFCRCAVHCWCLFTSPAGKQAYRLELAAAISCCQLTISINRSAQIRWTPEQRPIGRVPSRSKLFHVTLNLQPHAAHHSTRIAHLPSSPHLFRPVHRDRHRIPNPDEPEREEGMLQDKDDGSEALLRKTEQWPDRTEELDQDRRYAATIRLSR